MADKGIPSFIKVEPGVLPFLIQETAGQDTPSIPIDCNDGEFVINREKWDQWVRHNNAPVKWPSFVKLFRAQVNDDDPTSLSAEDLSLVAITAPEKSDAEITFAKIHGYPESVIMDGERQVLRMPNGQFWTGLKERAGYTFRQIARQEGRELETQIANTVLKNLNDRFEGASFSQRLAMKRTMSGQLSDRDPQPPKLGNDVENVHHFADREYRLGNANAKIAYRPGGEMDRYFLSQPQNGCVAASILNGAFSSGSGITKDAGLLMKFYRRLGEIAGSPDGRVDMQRLLFHVKHGEISGLVVRDVKAENVDGLVKDKKPVVAVVPYFNGHAIVIIGSNFKENWFKAVDTVSGMIVEEKFDPLAISTNEGIQVGSDETATNDMQKIMMQIADRAVGVAMGLEMETTYYSFEIKDPDAFLAWVNK